VTTLTDGQTLENVTVDGLHVVGNNVTIRNVKVLVPTLSIYVEGNDVMIDHVSSPAITISSASRTTIQYSNLSGTDEDTFHVTSDGDRYISGTKLLYNYLHDPKPVASAHSDGLQVRGATEMLVHCNVIDGGDWIDPYNAAVYLQQANGGDSKITVSNNWLYGYAWGIMLGNGTDFTVIGNHFGGDIHWGICYLNMQSIGAGFSGSGNVDDRSGKPFAIPSDCS
jgi:hypothetical protein